MLFIRSICESAAITSKLHTIYSLTLYKGYCRYCILREYSVGMQRAEGNLFENNSSKQNKNKKTLKSAVP